MRTPTSRPRGVLHPLHAQGGSPTRSWSIHVLLGSLAAIVVVLHVTQWIKHHQMAPSGELPEMTASRKAELEMLRHRKAALEAELARVADQLAAAKAEGEVEWMSIDNGYTDAKPDGFGRPSRQLGERPWDARDTSKVPQYPDLWPLPKTCASANTTSFSMRAAHFTFESESVHSAVLEQAFERYGSLIFGSSWKNRATSREEHGKETLELRGLKVAVLSEDERLQLDTDESYSLEVPSTEDVSLARLEAKTVYGALRGLETFSQLCKRELEGSNLVVLQGAPWKIEDAPRFPHRGLLIDTARHFLPMVHLKALIESLAYAKLNVLHWHMVDNEAFPIETPSFPDLWQGAYSATERYTLADLQEVVEFARMRGVRIVPEVDSPGHSRSWVVGYPNLAPSPLCLEPIDPSKPLTYQVLEGVLADVAGVFPEEMFHLGGDEVNTTCWLETPHIQGWMREQGFTKADGSLDAPQVYDDFTLRVQQVVRKLGRDPVQWEEAFLNSLERHQKVKLRNDNAGGEGRNLATGENGGYDGPLDKRMIVQVWNWENDGPALVMAVNAGMRAILSKGWYLDYLHVPWQAFYLNNPHANMTRTEQKDLVLGGEACMWGETVDGSNLEATVWPRLAAMAERLWSQEAVTSHEMAFEAAAPRLESFRRLLLERGVRAGPTHGNGREAPRGPGSYLVQ